jgi:hypothetical protein
MTKQEKLHKLDESVLDKMIEWIENDSTERLVELGNAISYLKANQVTEEKQKKDNDPIEERKRKLQEAEERRKLDNKI